MKQFTSKPLIVRYGETDQMGVVHHSNYLRYFEVARLEWLSALGVSYTSMEKQGIIMPVIDANLSYKTSALFDDSLIIHIELDEIPKVKIKFSYEIKNYCVNPDDHQYFLNLLKNLSFKSQIKPDR